MSPRASGDADLQVLGSPLPRPLLGPRAGEVLEPEQGQLLAAYERRGGAPRRALMSPALEHRLNERRLGM